MELLDDRLAPATFNVTTRLDVVDASDGVRSLREAINQANKRPGADTIIQKAGVYRINIPGTGENNNATGDFDVKDTLIIKGLGRGRTADLLRRRNN